MQSENIAIIDLGTNTFHLLVIELSGRSYRVLEKHKESVQLGRGGLGSGIMAPDAYKRGLSALQKFQKILHSRKVTHTLAYATSALRSASNGPQFVEEAFHKSGIRVRIINGYEEAVLIYEGVRHGVQLPAGQDCLFMDIGGGSVEFVVGDRRYPKLVRSLNLGGARLLEHLQPHDPMTADDIARAEQYLAEQLDPLLDEIASFGITQMVGSSGSFETLGTLVAGMRGQYLNSDSVNAYQFSVADYLRLHHSMLPLERKDRLALPGMDPVRVDMIGVGSLMVKYVVERLGIQSVLVSTFALKEGILFNFLAERHETPLHTPSEVSVRSSAVLALAERYKYDPVHARQTVVLAHQLFDQLASLHHYGTEERELLEYAALLHDIGHFIDRSGHHKHSQYIVLNTPLPGFSSDELLLLSNLVRYHRKSMPSPEHLHFNLLYKEDKQKVMILGGILRIAVNLDRAHRALVQRVEVNPTGRKLEITAYAPEDIELEVVAARTATDMLQHALERKVDIHMQVGSVAL